MTDLQTLFKTDRLPSVILIRVKDSVEYWQAVGDIVTGLVSSECPEIAIQVRQIPANSRAEVYVYGTLRYRITCP